MRLGVRISSFRSSKYDVLIAKDNHRFLKVHRSQEFPATWRFGVLLLINTLAVIVLIGFVFVRKRSGRQGDGSAE